MKKKKEYTEQQLAFLEHLFGEARGDYKVALALAGYSPNTRVSDVVKSLREEIVQAALDYLSLSAPKAAFEMVDVMSNPTKGGASIAIKAAQEVLNRSGVNTKDDISVKVPSGGIFIMPAKQVPIEYRSTEEEINDE